MQLFRGRKQEAEKTQRPDRLLRLLEITREIHGTLEVDTALQIILDAAIELTHLQRGFIALLNEEGELVFRMGRNNLKQTLTESDFQVSSSLMETAVKEKDLVFFDNLKDTPSISALKLHICCGVCVPLFTAHEFREAGASKKIVGCLYADSKVAVRFKEEEREITNALALHAGLALENAMLFEFAVRDGLTRLYQRRYFDSLCLVEWKRTQRYRRPLSVLMLDLDHFKAINDTYGHDEGDKVLRKVASCLRNCCRAEDVIGRYGGDEFIALLPETDGPGAALLAKRVLSVMPAKLPVVGSITVSIGIASYPAHSVETAEELIKLADLALYQAKQSGRNCYKMFDRISSGNELKATDEHG